MESDLLSEFSLNSEGAFVQHTNAEWFDEDFSAYKTFKSKQATHEM